MASTAWTARSSAICGLYWARGPESDGRSVGSARAASPVWRPRSRHMLGLAHAEQGAEAPVLGRVLPVFIRLRQHDATDGAQTHEQEGRRDDPEGVDRGCQLHCEAG